MTAKHTQATTQPHAFRYNVKERDLWAFSSEEELENETKVQPHLNSTPPHFL